MRLFEVNVHTLNQASERAFVVAEDYAHAADLMAAKIIEWGWDSSEVAGIDLRGMTLFTGNNRLAALFIASPYKALRERLHAELVDLTDDGHLSAMGHGIACAIGILDELDGRPVDFADDGTGESTR